MADWEQNWVDYYAILELDRTADQKTIKKQYRELVAKYHPDVYHGDDAHDKTALFNEAYNVLSDEEEKKAYDIVWDERQKGSQGKQTENYTNVSYDDVKKYYTEEEKRYAKQLALKKVIEEELQKIEHIIDAKSELIFAGYTEQEDKRDYYENVKEFLRIGTSFINDLTALALEAYQYDLLEEEVVLNNAVQYLQQELQTIPLTPQDAKNYVEKEQLKDQVKHKIADEVIIAQTLITKFQSLPIEACQGQITQLDYRTIRTSLLCEGKTSVSHLREFGKITKKLELSDENQTVMTLLSELDFMMITNPKDYQTAIISGRRELIKNKILNVIQDWKQYEKKIDRIINLLEKYPTSWRYQDIYNYAVSTLEEIIDGIKGIQGEIKAFPEVMDSHNYKPLSLSKEAEKIFEEAEKLHFQAEQVYQQKENVEQYRDRVITLSRNAYAAWDKGKALELFVQAQEVIDTVDFVYKYDEELDKLTIQLSVTLMTIVGLKQIFEEQYNIEKVNPYYNFNGQKFKITIKQLNDGIKQNIVSLITVGGIGALTAYYPLTRFTSGHTTGGQVALGLFLSLFAIGSVKVFRDYLEKMINLEKDKKHVKELFLQYQNKDLKQN